MKKNQGSYQITAASPPEPAAKSPEVKQEPNATQAAISGEVTTMIQTMKELTSMVGVLQQNVAELQEKDKPRKARSTTSSAGFEKLEKMGDDLYIETTSHLPERKDDHLRQQGDRIIPDAWTALTKRDHELFLLELACSEHSVLSQEAEKQGLKAERLSWWNGCDLTTSEGVRKAVKTIEEKRPKFLWIATECGPFSPMQNLNQRTPQQKEDLKRKQDHARRQHIGGLVAAEAAVRLGCVVVWEWSRRCRAWKWEPIEGGDTNITRTRRLFPGVR